MLYAAYGSNLNHEQMAIRCPNAKFIGTGILRGYRLVFRGVADIEFSKNSAVAVGLWKITKDCLESLDRYEGFPHHYDREIVTINTAKKEVDAIVYFMNYTGYASPTHSYYKAIQDGYADCGLPADRLTNALNFTIERYTHEELFNAY